MHILIWPLLVIVYSLFAFIVGRFYERVQWNKLIGAGVIPRPPGGHRAMPNKATEWPEFPHDRN